MEKKDLYDNCHLVVAAIRILSHKNGMPPSVESLGEVLSFSLEECHFLCRRLEKMGVIDIIEGAFGTKLFVKNHLELETIPRDEKDTKLKDDIEKFFSTKKDYNKEIESFKAEQEKKKKDLFAEIDEKIKSKLKK